jgi:hypothetical protein
MKARLIRLERKRKGAAELYWAETKELAEQVREQARRDGRPIPPVIVSGDPEDNPAWEMLQGRTLEEMLEALDRYEAVEQLETSFRSPLRLV